MLRVLMILLALLLSLVGTVFCVSQSASKPAQTTGSHFKIISPGGSGGHYYANGFDTRGFGKNINARFLVLRQAFGPDAHGKFSLTELYIRDARDHAVEVGVVSCPDMFGGDWRPRLFVASWHGDKFNGWGRGFKNACAACDPDNLFPAKPMITRIPLNSWHQFGTIVSYGRVSITYDGKVIGYFPSREAWGDVNAWSGTIDSRCYGETYRDPNKANSALPTMNGAVNAYSGTFEWFGASSPYRIWVFSAKAFRFYA